MFVDHGRIVEDEILLAAGRTVVVHQVELQAGESLGALARLGDGRRGANELRRGSVELADALEAADQIGKMAAVDTAIIVQLVDDEVAEILECLRPVGVMRENSA